jgi:2-polyprenyl-3-methyl-5-hydroxy-6-metoxy-1,4-benzoquinol methylase
VDHQSRHDIERAKWDAHAHDHGVRPGDLGPEVVTPPDLTFDRYADDHLTMTGMAAFVGDLHDRSVLEYGCGLGTLTVVLARSGARVTAIDLSPASVEVARRRAEVNGVADRIEFVIASGEALPFPDASFDVAVGKAVLHHIDPHEGARELARVLRPGGRATFSEPLGTNPLLVFARAHLPYPAKHHRGADRPLTRADLRAWRAPFAGSSIRPIQLLSMLERAVGFGHDFPILRRIDTSILRMVPGSWRLCRYAVLYLEASSPATELASEVA